MMVSLMELVKGPHCGKALQTELRRWLFRRLRGVLWFNFKLWGREAVLPGQCRTTSHWERSKTFAHSEILKPKTLGER